MEDGARWTFLTNHGHVLLSIARNPDVLLKDVANLVGITERAAQRIVADLVAEGYLAATREGRRNRYKINASKPFRHPVEKGYPIGPLLEIFRKGEAPSPAVTKAKPA